MTQKNDSVTSTSPMSNGNGNGNGNGTSPQSPDPMARILYAYDLESRGDIDAARDIYQQIIEQDHDGTYGAIAGKAIAAMGESAVNLGDIPDKIPDKDLPSKKGGKSKKTKPRKSLSLSWFYDLPVGRKQFTALIASELLSLSLVGFGAFLIGRSLQDQLFKQA